MVKKNFKKYKKVIMGNSKKRQINLSVRAHTIPKFYILEIDEVANKLIDIGKDVIKLNLGKSELPLPKCVADEMSTKIYDSVKRELIEPKGLEVLREKIADLHNKKSKIRISPNQIFINHGTSPFFLSLLLLLINPGEEVLFPLPYYPSYIAGANLAGAKNRFYNIKNGKIDLNNFEKQFRSRKIKIIFLNSPGNPYGNILSKEELKKILDIVDGKAIIISDEIYDEFTYANNFISILEVCESKRDNIVILNGFSKTYHMYTRRLGYAIVPMALTSALLKFQQHNLVCIDAITQFGGLTALNNIDNIRKETKDEIIDFNNRLEDCKKIIDSTKLKLIRPEGGFYMCVDVSAYINDETPTSLLLAKKILDNTYVAVTPSEDFGIDNFFRISLTCSKVVEGVDRICRYLNKL